MVATDTNIDELITLGKQQDGKVTDSQVLELLKEYKTDDDLALVRIALSEANIKIAPDSVVDDSDAITPEEEWAGGAVDSIAIYLHDIGQYTILTPDEELELAFAVQAGQLAQKTLDEQAILPSNHTRKELDKKIEAGVRAKNELITHNLRFVVSIARHYQKSGVPLLDLIQSGNMGLMKGIDKFDPDKGFRLTTYVGWWINQAINRYIAKQSRQFSLPVYLSDNMRKVNAITAKLYDEFGTEPTEEMIAKEANLPAEKIRELKAIDNRVISFDTPVSEDSETTFAEILEDENSSDPVQYSENQVLRDALLNTMSCILSEREATVLKMRFGFDGPAKTLDEVGAILHVTKERIRQIEKRALEKMRNTTRNKAYIDFLPYTP